MPDIQINVTEQVSPKNVATIDRPDLNLTGNAFSKQEVNQAITDAQLTSVKGEAIPTTSPSPWQSGDPDLYEKWDVNTVGTYSNFKDSNQNAIIVTVNDLNQNFVQIRVKNGVSSKSMTSKPIATGFVTLPFSSNITFEIEKAITKKTLSEDINYTYYGGQAVANSLHIHEIITNGFNITFDSAYSTQIQSDIDYSKPISIMFHKPLTANLKPVAIVVNLSEIDTTAPLPRFKINTVGGTLINTWFEWFEFPAHTVVSTDSIFNVGFFNYGGQNFIGANFCPVGSAGANRWANFAILDAEWQPNTVYQPNGSSINNVRFKTTSVKPTQLVTANTNNHTFETI